jgi:hypothetical protein
VGLRFGALKALGSCSSRHLITCFLSSKKLHHHQEVDPGFIGGSAIACRYIAVHSGVQTSAVATARTPSARWKRWTVGLWLDQDISDDDSLAALHLTA